MGAEPDRALRGQGTQARRREKVAAVLAALFLAACTQPRDSLEEQVRAFLARGEEAVRQRDVGTIKAMTADDYRDDEGRDKRAVTGIAAYHFLHRGSIHIATRLKSLSFPGYDAAKAELLAALGRTEIDLSSLPQIDADVYVVSLDLRRGAEGWQIRSASWHPATTEDLGPR